MSKFLGQDVLVGHGLKHHAESCNRGCPYRVKGRSRTPLFHTVLLIWFKLCLVPIVITFPYLQTGPLWWPDSGLPRTSLDNLCDMTELLLTHWWTAPSSKVELKTFWDDGFDYSIDVRNAYHSFNFLYKKAFLTFFIYWRFSLFF